MSAGKPFRVSIIARRHELTSHYILYARQIMNTRQLTCRFPPDTIIMQHAWPLIRR